MAGRTKKQPAEVRITSGKKPVSSDSGVGVAKVKIGNNVKEVRIDRVSIEVPNQASKPRNNKGNLLQIRMSADSMAILKEAAEWKGLSNSALARMWILQHLAQERKENPGRSKHSGIYRSTITLPDDDLP